MDAAAHASLLLQNFMLNRRCDGREYGHENGALLNAQDSPHPRSLLFLGYYRCRDYCRVVCAVYTFTAPIAKTP